MSILRRCLPFALFTAPVEAFVREVLLPFMAGLGAVLFVAYKTRRRPR